MSTVPSSLLAATPITRPRPKVAFWAVFTWLAIQALALIAAAMRIPFSARFPSPEEHLALYELAVAQMVGSALLFPILMQCFSTAMLVIASAPVMVLFAGLLAEVGQASTLLYFSLYAVLWLISLALWNSVLRCDKTKMYGVAVASLLVIGGIMLGYLQREFGEVTSSFDYASHGYFGPLMGEITLLESGPGTGTIWYFLGAFVLSALIAALARRVLLRRTFSTG